MGTFMSLTSLWVEEVNTLPFFSLILLSIHFSFYMVVEGMATLFALSREFSL